PALEFSLLADDAYRLLPWILRLPTYAAVAQFHGKASLPPNPDTDFATVRGIIEHFSLTEVLPGLAQGDALDAPQAQALYARLARTIGLPGDLVGRHRGKITPQVFVKALLRDTQRLVSLYDGTITTVDSKPDRHVHNRPKRSIPLPRKSHGGVSRRLPQLCAGYPALYHGCALSRPQFPGCQGLGLAFWWQHGGRFCRSRREPPACPKPESWLAGVD